MTKRQNGEQKVIFVSIPDHYTVGESVLRGVKSYLKSRVNWRFIGPQWGTYRQDWFNDLDQLRKDVDIVLPFEYFPISDLLEIEKLFGRIFYVGPGSVSPGWWQFYHSDSGVGRQAADYLKKTGMNHFGYVGFENYEFSKHRFQGYREGLEVDPTDILLIEKIDYRYFTEEGYPLKLPEKYQVWIDKLKDWMAELPPRTALFCANDNLGRDVLNTANLMGIQVPEHLCVLGVDNGVKLCTSLEPTLSSIDLQWEELGHHIAERMLDCLSQPVIPELGGKLVFDAFFVQERESTRSQGMMTDLFWKMQKYLEDHLSENPTREQVARAIGTSDRSLARYLRSQMNTSFQIEKGSIQLEKTYFLLKNSEKKLEDIAEMSGFSNASSLARWLKHKTGLTPRQLANSKSFSPQECLKNEAGLG
ncbi:MAG: substrate-binding domain-containing protein [Opitutales bacterium]|nr:substrate-binding domain-containing protein [Opitutales bacterium]MCH8539368.1 substrate-binding domain-containing protein [Opitutales bacterium]